MAALGLSYYETLFSVNAEQQWTDFNKAWDAGNTISVYERPATFWVWALRTGDQKWFTRADAMLKDYRDRFLLANAGNDPAQVNPSAHFSQAESLYLHWKITGDTLSRDCAVSIATHAIAYTLGYLTNLAGPVDARIQARVLVAFYIGVLIKGENYQPSDQNPTTYGQYLDQCITDVLGTMNADGYAEFASTCGGSLNYMCGMLADILTRIYDQRPGTYNATILTKMTALGTYLWNTQWRGGGSDASFNYNSVFCAGTGSATSAPDENGLIAPLFGWLYKTTADAAWKTKGDQILAGMQQAGGIYLYRQFSELFDSSYRYLGYAHPDHLLT
jgi:hypothetical protein